jgi:hypothetical protein
VWLLVATCSVIKVFATVMWLIWEITVNVTWVQLTRHSIYVDHVVRLSVY